MNIEGEYVKVSQFKELNLLQQIDTRRDEINITKSFMSERQSITHNDFTVNIHPEKLNGKRFQHTTSTKRLLAFIQAEFTSSRNDEIIFSIRDFANICNRTGIADLSKQIRVDLMMLDAISFDIQVKNGAVHTGLFESYSVHYGIITIKLAAELFDVWKKRMGAMNLPLAYFSISAREHFFASDFLYYISWMRFLENKNKKHENILSIKSMLAVSLLPSLEQVRKTSNRSIKERIYKRFFGAIRAMATVVVATFYRGDKQMTEKEIMQLPYYEFVKITIHFEWIR